MNWLKRAEEICLVREQADIEQFLAFGQLMHDMLSSGSYRKICKAETYITSELAKKGKTFPQKYMQNAYMMHKRFTPIIYSQIVKLAMPVPIAMVACHWPDAVMEERLDIARHCGWQKITEKYLMRKQWVKKDRRCTPLHRANKVKTGMEVNLDLKTIRRNGELDHDAIVDILRNMITINPEFEKDLATAYQMCGKVLKIA